MLLKHALEGLKRSTKEQYKQTYQKLCVYLECDDEDADVVIITEIRQNSDVFEQFLDSLSFCRRFGRYKSISMPQKALVRLLRTAGAETDLICRIRSHTLPARQVLTNEEYDKLTRALKYDIAESHRQLALVVALCRLGSYVADLRDLDLPALQELMQEAAVDHPAFETLIRMSKDLDSLWGSPPMTVRHANRILHEAGMQSLKKPISLSDLDTPDDRWND
ncbi:hypothetical protein J8273_7655 [Carpediemonas membranifera]|uniref:Uncharacterized protein n=1 Tax=Carpediemonas membranifera TaxID=201153 RepID=A0A8J6B703_9EUKA|nr:hypothetical protein J8273_7655 [Carpediemonas membranifera]|eukprot:KAG9391287.1 hypothetical protein J8273_7655 [Carpediemonas membranifera]